MKTSMGCLASSFRYEKLEEGLGESKTFSRRITLGFVSGIIQTGNEKPLEEADLSSLDLQDTQHLTEKLEEKWQQEIKVKKESCSQPSLWNAMRKAVDKKAVTLAVLLTILSSFCRLIQPVVLSFLLEEISNSSSPDAIILCLDLAALFISSLVGSCVHHHSCYNLYLMAVEVKASLIGLVYKKVGAC